MAVILVDPSKVNVVPPKSDVELRIQRGNLRVCAYARVSTDDEEQLTSYHSQIEHYTNKIKGTNGWDFVNVFADEGITGTSTKKRTEFNRMIEKCKKGKIDLILTKSISRFARNSLDSIQYARMLKRLGVGVIFEKESIDTRELTNEMIFVVLSAFAQAESESMSANISIGKRNGYKQGRYTFPNRMYGYEVIEGIPQIVENEGAVVRMIFNEYLKGSTLREIKAKLEQLGIHARNKKNQWQTAQIDRILSNEKYKGYVILQKTFVDDLFTKTIKVNNGELPMYIIPGAHEPIVSEQIFDAVQALKQLRNKSKTDIVELGKTGQSKYSGKYALTQRVYCGECGSEYKRVTWRRKRNGKETVTEVWKCKKRHQKVSYCEHSHIIKEYELHSIIHEAITNSLANLESISTAAAQNIQSILLTNAELPRLSAEIIRKRQQLEILMGTVPTVAPEEKSDMFQQIKLSLEEIHNLEQKESKLQGQLNIELIDSASLQRVSDLCSTATKLPESYDDILTSELVKTVIIHADETVDVTFIDGSNIKGLRYKE